MPALATTMPPRLDPARFSPAARQKLGGPGLRAFQHIAGLWRLTEAERLLVLGLPSRSTYYGWPKAGDAVKLPVDALLRISAVLGIHKALRILFETEAEGAAWLRATNAALPFAGQAPMGFVTSGTQDGLMQVRRFLDAARGGLHMAPNAADEAPAWRDEDIVIA